MKTKKLKPTKNKPTFKSNHSVIEIEGLIKMFNDFIGLHYNDSDKSTNFEFFYCDESICSTDCANGKPVYFEGLGVHYIDMTTNNLTYIICQDEKEKEYIFEFNKYTGDFYLIK